MLQSACVKETTVVYSMPPELDVMGQGEELKRKAAAGKRR